jgi:hypothetical protein
VVAGEAATFAGARGQPPSAPSARPARSGAATRPTFHLIAQEDPMAKGANPPKKETKKPKKDAKAKEPKK